TTVLATVVMSEREKDADYFPLVVDYEERFYAGGKIMGSRFLRREGRPSEEAILSGRIIDRSVRPLFDHRLRREVQLVITILEVDRENDPDFVALVTASAALAISEIPWNGPVAAVKLFHDGKKLVINPTGSEIEKSWPANKGFLSFVAGTTDRINMIELEGIDADDESVAKAYDVAQKEITKIVDWINKIVKEVGKPKVVVHLAETDITLAKVVKDFLNKDSQLEKAMYRKDKMQRESSLRDLKEKLAGHLLEQNYDEKTIGSAERIFETELDDLVHHKILTANERPDGRKLDEIRELHAETSILKRTHGSALFVRGNTQALAITTIAPPGSEQLIESLKFSGKKRFMLHYNFPPYSVGEVGRVGNPGRREIGHGALAEKAVRNIIPPQEQFPYTIRVVSEIVSSNGSSSMATVCGACLSLMDAGVPIIKPVAGIAMGLMTGKNGEYKVLTDIQGPEDHYGDMDFKVAGTTDGVRAIQMDVKIDGLTNKMLIDGLAQAKKARLEILKVMKDSISEPRKETSIYAPKVLSMQINPSKIGEIIGPGGKTINGIIEKTGALTIDVEQDGRVFVAGPDKSSAEAAYKEIESIVKEYQVGDIVEGKIVKVLEFGAILEFGPGRDGMIHISELKNGFVKKVEEVVNLGDSVKARVVKVEPGGRIGLSLKGLE
ncbi:MAG: polyribonucleotide nucleotidyltransferase, partial [bacterium]|nr:polyribonucleotide nucleotidyltransferase [bacterium]